MAGQLEFSEMRFPPEVGAEIQKAVEGLGVSFPAESEKEKAEKSTTPFPRSPFIMFINGKSGGGLGPALLEICSKLLTPPQVFDLGGPAKPHKVVPAVLDTLDSLIAASNNESAKAVRSNLKIFVAGGDGTVGWLLSVLENVTNPPPIAVIPLGTGNDLSRSFGWGPTFPLATEERIGRRLREGAVGKPSNLDSWVVTVTPSPDMNSVELEKMLPHALSKSTAPGPDGMEVTKFSGNFYLYFSFGMDAQVAYAFHHLRNTKPHIARGPRINKAIYGAFGCTQGWFCATCAPQGQARCLHMIANMQIQKTDGGRFEDLNLDNSLRAIMVLNLQSYAGGRNPWGHPEKELESARGWTEARQDDGKLEIVGLRDGWSSLFMLGQLKGATRVAQAYGIRIEFRGEHNNKTHLQVDGEPWEQKLSVDSREPTIVEIMRKPKKAFMLANDGAMVLEHPPIADPVEEAQGPAVPPDINAAAPPEAPVPVPDSA